MVKIVARARRVVGSIDTLVGRILYGWIYYPDLPDDPITVKICVDGEPVATAVANLYREDLRQAGKGNGLHAFEVEIPKECFDDGLHTIALQDVSSGAFLRAQLDKVRLDRHESLDVRGKITGLKGGEIVGYAFDRRDAKSVVSVGLLVDGHELGSAVADQPIPAGANSADTPPNCGFAIPVAHLNLDGLIAGRAILVSRPEMEVIDVFKTFGQEFARLHVRMCGDVLVASIDVKFVPAKPLAFDMFVNAEPYTTIDISQKRGQMTLPVSIFVEDPRSGVEVSSSYRGTELQIGNSPQVVRQRRNLVKNSTFERWEGSVPSVWQLSISKGASATKGFCGRAGEGFSARHTLVLESGDVASSSLAGARIYQTVDALPQETGQLDVLLAARAEPRASVRITLSWLRKDGSEVEVEKEVALGSSWGMCAARLQVPPMEEGVSVTLSITADYKEARRIEFGLVSAGLPGFTADAGEESIAHQGGALSDPGSAVRNGNFEYWRDALRVRASSRRILLAEDWVLSCKESCPDLEARLIELNRRKPSAGISTSTAYGLALFGPTIGKSVRLQTDLNKLQLAHLDQGYFTFVASKASMLSDSHGERKGVQSVLSEILIVERETAEDTSEIRETKILTLKSRLVIPPQPEQFDIALSVQQTDALRRAASRALYDPSKNLALIFEFSDFIDFVLTDVSLGPKPQREEEETHKTGYVALEDLNISAQLPRLKGLTPWGSSETLYPPKLDKATPIKAVPAWEWLPLPSHGVDIIVCVHDAIEETLACLDSVRSCTEIPHTVTIVDDASGGGTREQLRQYTRDTPWIRLIALDDNLGYTRAANVGLMSSRADWVVLLNSDTIVSPGWLTGMFEVTAAKPDVALVGPLSNAASWQSVPDLTDVTGKWKVNELPEGCTVTEMAEVVRSLSVRGFPEVPLLNGFCTLMRRKVLEEVGFLDEVAFPIGYGEENDLCVRVAKAGYKLAIADHVYVYHAKSASFGTAGRDRLASRGAASFASKHPEVDIVGLQQILAESTPLFQLRKALRQHLDARQTRAVSPQLGS